MDGRSTDRQTGLRARLASMSDSGRWWPLSDRRLLLFVGLGLLPAAGVGQWQVGKMNVADPMSVVLSFGVYVAFIVAAWIFWHLGRHLTGFGPYLSAGLKRFKGGLPIPPDDSELRDGVILNARKGMTGWLEHLDVVGRLASVVTVTADSEIDNADAWLLRTHEEPATPSVGFAYLGPLRNVVQFMFPEETLPPGGRLRIIVYSLSNPKIRIAAVRATRPAGS